MAEEPADIEHLYVPLRDAGCGVALRLFCDRDGARCAVGFTRLERLVAVLGAEQRYYRLTERSVRELARQRGVAALVVDPGMVAAPVRDHAPAIEPSPAGAKSTDVHPHPHLHAHAPWDPRATAVLAISAASGAAALLIQVLS